MNALLQLDVEDYLPRSGRFHLLVLPWQRAIEIRDGAVVAERGPGRYRRRHRRRSTWLVADMRHRLLPIATQEVVTADGVQVRVSLAVGFTITSASRWLLAEEDPSRALYLAVQLVLRERVGGVELAGLMASRRELMAGAEEECAEVAEQIGVQLDQIAVRDVTMPAEVRAAMAKVALTRELGKAELERARAETAALRSMANSARLLAESPQLLQLRTVMAAEQGAEIVVHTEGNR